MIAPYKLTCEEPIVANEHLWELVEATGSVELSQFTTSDLHRYTFHWRRNVILDDEDFARWFGMLSADGVLSEISTVVAWPHDIAGNFRARHRFVERALIVRGWDVSCRPGLGVALLNSAPIAIHSLPDPVRLELGWFVMWGAKLHADGLTRAPFETVLTALGVRRSFIPSSAFLNALGARGAGVGYSINVDSGDPRAVLVDARKMCSSLSKYCSVGSAT